MITKRLPKFVLALSVTGCLAVAALPLKSRGQAVDPPAPTASSSARSSPAVTARRGAASRSLALRASRLQQGTHARNAEAFRKALRSREQARQETITLPDGVSKVAGESQ